MSTMLIQIYIYEYIVSFYPDISFIEIIFLRRNITIDTYYYYILYIYYIEVIKVYEITEGDIKAQTWDSKKEYKK